MTSPGWARSEHTTGNSVIYQVTIDLSEAQRVISACQQRSLDLGRPFSICVLDSAGYPVAMARMDGASFQSIDVARGKALAAVMMQANATTVENLSFAPHRGIPFDSGGIVPIQGALPLLSRGICVGAVAASGGEPDQDDEVARAGVSAFGWLSPGRAH
jgi:glc operon protein GlcG